MFQGGLGVDEAKVAKIKELGPPKDHSKVKNLWGMVVYQNQFIENLAGIGRLITRLLSPSIPFNWTTKCGKAFDYIKQKLASSPVVMSPLWDQPFIIMPSSNEVVVACVLVQNDNTGHGHPIFYMSRL